MKGAFLSALGMTAVLVATGCGRAHKTVPLGNWVGNGRYVDCQSFLDLSSQTVDFLRLILDLISFALLCI